MTALLQKPLMIRQAKIEEIAEILHITSACASHMAGQGIYQWNADYPSEAVFKRDIRRGELYVLESAKSLVGIVVVSKQMDKEYVSVSWLSPTAGNIYIHRLAIHPDFQGNGYARQLMDFAEARARALGAPSIRLDTFSQNKRNQRFYEQRGYIKLGDIYFPRQSQAPFHCYELLL